jgi:hypothetical protein
MGGKVTLCPSGRPAQSMAPPEADATDFLSLTSTSFMLGLVILNTEPNDRLAEGEMD